MNALIFSDSHGRARAMRAAIERQITPPDAIFFLGDGLRDAEGLELDGSALYAVRGNCDWFSGYDDTPGERVVRWAGLVLLITHGHDYSVKSGVGSILRRAAALEVDAVLFGHTHEPLCERIPAGTVVGGSALLRDLWLFNPGSIGMSGSFGTLTVQGGTPLFSHGSA